MKWRFNSKTSEVQIKAARKKNCISIFLHGNYAICLSNLATISFHDASRLFQLQFSTTQAASQYFFTICF